MAWNNHSLPPSVTYETIEKLWKRGYHMELEISWSIYYLGPWTLGRHLLPKQELQGYKTATGRFHHLARFSLDSCFFRDVFNFIGRYLPLWVDNSWHGLNHVWALFLQTLFKIFSRITVTHSTFYHNIAFWRKYYCNMLFIYYLSL